MKVLVCTISDRASRQEYEDRSGPEVENVLRGNLPDVHIDRLIVPDEAAEIEAAFAGHPDADCIITTGGTGIGPRDITPDVTARYCERLLPGIAEILRSRSYEQTPHAMLSRGVAGIKGSTIIINLPGSVRGARFCAELLVPVLEHARKMLAGEGH